MSPPTGGADAGTDVVAAASAGGGQRPAPTAGGSPDRSASPPRQGGHRGAGRPGATGPRVERLVGLVARAALEVIAGRRPLRQLLRLVSPAVYDRLRAQLPAPRDRRPAPSATAVRRVLACWPCPDACEATVLVDRDGRTTALAVRAERHRGAWRIVEVTAPEAGLPPVRTRPGTSAPLMVGATDA